MFYLQYAYARICNIIKQSNNEKLSTAKTCDLNLLSHENELIMLKHMAQFPVVDIAYENFEPQYVAVFLLLASCFHKFYNSCKVNTNDTGLTNARIKLIKAVKIILNTALTFLELVRQKNVECLNFYSTKYIFFFLSYYFIYINKSNRNLTNTCYNDRKILKAREG